MTPSRTHWLLCALPFLASCQQDASSLRPVAVAPVTDRPAQIEPAKCPPAGLQLRTSDGREFHFLGRDPSDQEVCLWSVANVRTVARQLHGLQSPDGEVGRQTRIGMRPLFPLQTGKSASYTVQRTDGMWRVQWRVVGEQRLTVPAGTFDVWVLEQIEEGMAGNTFRGERMFYIDQVSGSAVKVDSRLVRGQGNLGRWEALSLAQR